MGGSQKEGEATSGPNPYELLSASLAACTAMTVRLYSDRKGYPLDRVQVAVSFQRGPVEGRDRYGRTIFLDGPLDEDQRARILLMADQCPVGKTLGRGADITTFLSPEGDRNVTPARSEYMKDMETVAAIEDPWREA
jgi:putative redox protein